jgi:hypothetical protein
MSKTTVVGSAPIAFTTAGGTALSIPLSTLSFVDSKIQIDIQPAGISASDKSDLESWLNYLVKIETLKKSTKKAPNPAISIEALDSGEIGNSIKIKFDNFIPDTTAPLDKNKATFDAVVTYEKTYALSYDPTATKTFVKNVLGTETTPGTQPGLVHLKSTDTPDNIKPKANTYKLTGGTASKKSSKPVDRDPSGADAFNLEAFKNGSDGNSINVKIADVSDSNKTFTLTVVWEKTVPGIKSTNLEVKFGEFDYLIKIAKPRDASNSEIDYSVPDAGVIVLNGGAEPKDAVPAKATAFIS